MSPLAGVGVVTTALNVPGPVAIRRLADAGATIVKIEPPSGDPLQAWCPEWYDALHRGLDVRRIDLKSDDGQRHLRHTLASAQLLVTSQRPSALGRLRLDRGALAADPRTAHLRLLSIVGSQATPESAGHDLTYVASAGLLGGEMPKTLLADIFGAERAFSAALLLLAGTEGQQIDVGLVDAIQALTMPRRFGMTGAGTILGGGLAAYGVYQASNGRVAVAALEPHFRTRLYQLLGRPLDGPLIDAFAHDTAEHWDAWGREHDLPICRVAD